MNMMSDGEVFTFSIFPSKEQEDQLLRTIKASRFVYNWAAMICNKAVSSGTEKPSTVQISKMLTALKSEPNTGWLGRADSVSLQVSAMTAVRRSGAGPRMIPFIRSTERESMTTRYVRMVNGVLRIPKVGDVQYCIEGKDDWAGNCPDDIYSKYVTICPTGNEGEWKMLIRHAESPPDSKHAPPTEEQQRNLDALVMIHNPPRCPPREETKLPEGFFVPVGFEVKDELKSFSPGEVCEYLDRNGIDPDEYYEPSVEDGIVLKKFGIYIWVAWKQAVKAQVSAPN